MDDLLNEDFDEAGRRAGRLLDSVETLRGDLEEINGVGEAAAGQVKARVTANGKVLEVTFGPRTPRTDSRALAEQVLIAVLDAQRDAELKCQELMRETLDGYDPAAARADLDRMLGLRW
ncbi:YbaB/EbfC family nucleoid-associated protein [Nonomuraea gerenzanensis]|uniref:YbaB/EbfC family nucleoid-associated protein n=1 Tax=Nonomuraea gerenzanensis TaxID=93944 RepID=UPI001CD98E07|nr:YbaB/EbfC family nucleoid-associated protein [Nonomuraea gerenzanensis]UBU11532.1 YbaB/EbfC family nucleoid-associated protein [Nonomuraea gerenzanensis]